MPPVAFERPTMLRRLADEEFDVVVVGGGITGAGVALDAASRGLRTALVDQGDFASGTSSKSSKLIHGGLRYLQQGEVALVYEALAERQRLRKLAPHLVRVIPFMIPILARGGVVNPKVARALGSAMWMYDLTGGARIGRLHERLDRDEALAHLPTMPADRLVSAYLYYDGRADDARLCLTVARTAPPPDPPDRAGALAPPPPMPADRLVSASLYYDGGADDARLCLTVARTAASYGAVLVNYATVTGFVKDGGGRVQAVKVRA